MYKVRTKQLTDEEITEYHGNRIFELSLKIIGAVPWLYKPTEDQKQWVLFRLRHPNTWPNIRENKIGDRTNWK